MRDMYSQTRLAKRGSVYYFRAAIPRDLVKHFGKKEITYSLKTKDHRAAKSLCSQASAKLDREFEQLREGIAAPEVKVLNVVNDDAINSICTAWKYHALEGDAASRTQGLSDEEFEEHSQERLATIESLREILAKGRMERIQPALESFLHLIGVDYCGSGEDLRILAWKFLETVIDTHLAVIQRDHGEVVMMPSAPKPFRSGSNKRPESPSKGQGKKSLQDCFPLWLHKRKNRNAKTVAAYRASMDDFIEFAGNRPVIDYDSDLVYAFVEEKLDLGDQRPRTINKNIGFLRAIVAAAKKRLKLTNNPFSEIEVPGLEDDVIERLPYTQDDLNRIFSFPIYSEGERPKGGAGAASVWLPLLDLFTGARLEELGQLHVADIKQEQGIWYLGITDIIDDAKLARLAPKKLKTPDSRRRIPVHSQLIESGFLSYVERVKATGAMRLFPDLQPDNKGDLTGNFSKWYGRYRRKHGITGYQKPFHSFRHTFRDALREAEIDVMVANALMGHKDDSMGGNYGLGHSLNTLNRAIQQISYPDVETPVLA